MEKERERERARKSERERERERERDRERERETQKFLSEGNFKVVRITLVVTTYKTLECQNEEVMKAMMMGLNLTTQINRPYSSTLLCHTAIDVNAVQVHLESRMRGVSSNVSLLTRGRVALEKKNPTAFLVCFFFFGVLLKDEQNLVV